jgi:hypothetical protein
MVSKKLIAATPLAALLPILLVSLVHGSGSGTPSQTVSRTSVSSASVSPAPPSSAERQREAVAERFVGKCLRTWQQRLDLKEWNVKVDLVRPTALEPKTLGNIHWDINTKQARISVLSAYDYKLATPAMLDDMEFTVVHELVHLQLATLPHTDASRMPEEHAVNELAHALLQLAKH